MPRRKVPLAIGEMYHICTKSIAEFKIFNSDKDYERMIDEIKFYSVQKPPCSFSLYKKLKGKSISKRFFHFDYSQKLVDVIAYCIMPTHIHFILKETKKYGIETFIRLILNSYSKYFNLKHKRKGPLWEARFANILIENDEQFLHVTRYIHLNPVTAYLVDNPGAWLYSSYKEYIGAIAKAEKICSFSEYLGMDIPSYIAFVSDQIGYQRELSSIKHLILD